jgi:hypothetical protein
VSVWYRDVIEVVRQAIGIVLEARLWPVEEVYQPCVPPAKLSAPPTIREQQHIRTGL